MSLSIGTSIDLTGTVVITVRGSVERGGAAQVGAAVQTAIEQHRPDMIHIDLSQVTYVDPADAAALDASRRSARTGGTRVVLRNASSAVARSLRTGGSLVDD